MRKLRGGVIRFPGVIYSNPFSTLCWKLFGARNALVGGCFKFLYPRAQPIFEQPLRLRLVILCFQIFDSVARLIERNVMAGYDLSLMLRGHELEKVTVSARMRAVWIAVVKTAQ